MISLHQNKPLPLPPKYISFALCLFIYLFLSAVTLATVQTKPHLTENRLFAHDNKRTKHRHHAHKKQRAQLGPRPFYLMDAMDDSELKTSLEACENQPFYKTDFSIGHRGAAMQFPEHTKESYQAAARMGAGIIECDVTFTKDRELVCRHSQCDLHQTTNILVTDLAQKCTQAFTPADPITGQAASASCCTSDITLNEFKTLCGKMDAFDPNALTPQAYIQGTPNWRTDLYASCGTVMSHKESIELFQQLGVKFTPELKSPSVDMPFEGTYSQEEYAQQMIEEYTQAGVSANDVWPQSFNVDDVRYWIQNNPRFGKQAVYLDGRYDNPNFDHTQKETWFPSMDTLVSEGVTIIAPPLWMLLALDDKNNIIPSTYAMAAKASGLDIIAWTLERSAPLDGNDGGWYYQSIKEAITNDSDILKVLDVLAMDVGVIGVFSDWPSTVTFYANCKGL